MSLTEALLSLHVTCNWVYIIQLHLNAILWKFVSGISYQVSPFSDHFLYSRHLNVQTSSDHIKRNFIFIKLRA